MRSTHDHTATGIPEHMPGLMLCTARQGNSLRCLQVLSVTEASSRGGRCVGMLCLLPTWVVRRCTHLVLAPVCCVRSFPSSLPALTALTRSATAVSDTSRNSATASTNAVASPTPLPVLTVGLGRNGDCIPAQGNYRRFHEAAAAGGGAPAALVVLSEVRLLVCD